MQVTDWLGQGPREDVSSLTKDFGAYGDDPLNHQIGAAKEMTNAATTRDLAVGTARSTRQIPGIYMPYTLVPYQRLQSAILLCHQAAKTHNMHSSPRQECWCHMTGTLDNSALPWYRSVT